MKRFAGARMATRRWPFYLFQPAPAAAPVPPPPRYLGPLLALAFLAFYALTSAATLSSRDGGVMYDTAMAIVNRHTLALPPHHHGLPGVHGGFYSKYGLAQSVAEIPLFVVGQALAALATPPLASVVALAVTMLANSIISALVVWLVFLLAYELRADARGAAIAAILVGAASPLWPYAKTDFSEPLSTLSLTGAALFLVRARTRPHHVTYAVSGLFVALALLTKLTAALALPALGLYALYTAVTTAGGRTTTAARRIAGWTVPIAAGVGLTAAYNVARYGHLADTGYHAEDLPFHAPFWRGLEGLLVSPGKGLLWYCLLVLVALALWPAFLSRRRAEGLLALGIVLPTLAVYATYPIWWGGICWGPRYLLPVLPFMLLPLAALYPAVAGARVWRRAAVAVIAVSVLVQGLGVAVHPARFLATGISDARYLWEPSDSPLLGHAWLAAYDALAAIAPADARAMLAGYPWRRPHGVSPTQRQAIANWDYWWWEVLGRRHLRRAAQAGLAAALLLVLAAALWGLRALGGLGTPERFDHERMAVRS